MPELPEVEIMTRNIDKWFAKRTLSIEILDKRWLKQGELQLIQGQKVLPARVSIIMNEYIQSNDRCYHQDCKASL